MSNPFKDMEREHRKNFRFVIDWESLSNERSIEVPWLHDRLKKEKPTDLLDVGFAGSFYQGEILDMGINYLGLDFDMSRITGQSLHVDAIHKEAWKSLIERFKWLQGDIVNPPEELMQKRFDMIISISTIEHIVPAGYASNYMDLQADLTAVANMKSMVKTGGSLLLTFPVGKTAYFYNPNVNRNIAAIKKTGIFKEGIHDQMFYDMNRIDQIRGEWCLEECTFYKRDENNKWIKCECEDACNIEHTTSEATTVCLLHLRKPKSLELYRYILKTEGLKDWRLKLHTGSDGLCVDSRKEIWCGDDNLALFLHEVAHALVPHDEFAEWYEKDQTGHFAIWGDRFTTLIRKYMMLKDNINVTNS